MQYFLGFKEIAGITLGFWVLAYVLYASYLPNPAGMSNALYAWIFLVLLCQLRGVVRARYAIPVSKPSSST